ncbi:ATP-binding transport protein NatA [Leifsonia rubra CMS 76R]|nr:ATP-binding transport protein NatA [Leifsonia rubra CMS 76R]
MPNIKVSSPALEISGLTKRFGEKLAVNSVDLVIPSGSFFGLVGPNGAGKTTTLSMATGLLRPALGPFRFTVSMSGRISSNLRDTSAY